MREIKFRAWDEELKTMDYQDNPIRGSHLFIVFNEGLGYARHRGQGKNNENLGVYYAKIMQYTGLKDKNGIEIYEGDIVRFETNKYSQRPSPNPKIIGTEFDYAQILFVSGGFIFHRKFWWNDKIITKQGDPLSDEQTKIWVVENCEVIGNIHENPELLKDIK